MERRFRFGIGRRSYAALGVRGTPLRKHREGRDTQSRVISATSKSLGHPPSNPGFVPPCDATIRKTGEKMPAPALFGALAPC